MIFLFVLAVFFALFLVYPIAYVFSQAFFIKSTQTPSLESFPEPSSPSPVPSDAKPPPREYISHPLQEGETLWDLAGIYYGDYSLANALVYYNGIANTRRIPTGREIRIPFEKMSYEVKQGDHLSGIAHMLLGDGRKYSIIAERNNISAPDFIRPGVTLELPIPPILVIVEDEQPKEYKEPPPDKPKEPQPERITSRRFSLSFFKLMFTNPLERRSIINSVVLGIVVTLATTLLSLPLSYFLVRYR